MGIKLKEEVAGSGIHNTLAPGTTVKGNMFAETDFRLDGLVEGNVHCKGKLVIGQKGKVVGQIITVNAEILGEIEGSLQVSNKLVVKSTAIINGDITTQVLEIEPNAHFNGSCSMKKDNVVKISAGVK